MRKCFEFGLAAILLLTLAGVASLAAGSPAQRPAAKAAAAEAGVIHVWAERHYKTWDNPMQSEFSINGKTINIFTSDTFEPIAQYLKSGWNTITIKTTPQQPANRDNHLLFRIGPMHQDPKSNKMIMEPVLWQFDNGTDWRLEGGTYSHPLGPGTQEVTLSFSLYNAGMDREGTQLRAGDYVLAGKPKYSTWNSPVTATVFVNGTPLNTFTLASRQIVITSLLKPGKNEIRLISTRVKNSIRDNDLEFAVAGPAEWNVQQNRFLLTPVLQFKAMQGWNRDSRSGQLINPVKPDSETIERVIPFFLKEAPAPAQ